VNIARNIDLLKSPRSYNIKLDDGKVIRRNRRHLQLVPDSVPDQLDNSVLSSRNDVSANHLDIDHSAESSDRNPNVVTTRSGRIVKAVNRMDV
jgi:hypothetical protein